MIFTESTIKISNNVSKMDSTIVLYRGDKNVEIRFTILQSPFKYSNTVATNVIESTNASYGQLVIKTPNDKPPIFSEVSATKEGTVLFTITKEMIDEIEELGVYTFQIRLMDENKQSRVTIPPVENGIEIKEPIAIEDDNTTNVVGLAKANYAVATLSDADIPTFDDNGKYNKTNWNDGDIITNASLNKIEDGIYTTNENITATKKYVDDNAVILPLPIHTTLESTSVAMNIVNIMDLIPGVQYSTHNDPNETKRQGYKVVYICDDGNFKTICSMPLPNKVVHLVKVLHYTNYSILSVNNTVYEVDYSKHSILTDVQITKTLQNYIPITNTIEYSPTNDYHPATKKYVDDRFICSYSMENVGTIPKEEMQKCNNGTSRYVSSINLKEFFADYKYCVYQGTYGDKNIRMKYDPQYNRILAYDLDIIDAYDITLAFEFNNNYMYPFNGGASQVKSYQFTNDLVITKSDILNPSEVLTKNNTKEYTPTNDYNPATKKYVDDNILLEQLPILRVDETNKRIYVNCNNMGTYKKYFVPNKYANAYGFSFIYTNEDKSETEIALIGGAMTRDDFILCARNTNTLFILILGGTDKYTYTKSTKTLEKGLYGYLKIGNTQEYTPTADYHPATKKYVDDIKTGIDGIKADLGTAQLTTNAKDVKGAVNEVNAQCKDIANNKADKNSVFTMANMGQDIKEAMTGGSVAVVGKGAILDENIAEASYVKAVTNNFYKEGLFNATDSIIYDNTYTDVNDTYTDRIVANGLGFGFNYNQDYDRIIIRGIKADNDGTLTIGICEKEKLSGWVTETDAKCVYTKKIPITANEELDFEVDISDMNSLLTKGHYYMMLFYSILDIESPTYNSNNAIYFKTIKDKGELVKETPIDDIKFILNYGGYNWSTIASDINPCTCIPAISLREKVSTKYECHIDRYVKRKSLEAAKQAIQLQQISNFAPNDIPLIQNDAVEIFYDSIFNVKNIENYNLKVTNPITDFYERKVKITATTETQNTVTTITLVDDFNRELSTTNLNFTVFPVKNPTTQKNLLIIGDSLTEFGDSGGCETASTLYEKLQANNITNINFIGTKSGRNTNAKNEGRAGWRSWDYMDVNREGNPFVHNKVIDFNAYCTVNNFTGIDYCIIHMNWNAFGYGAETMWRTLKELADKLLESYPQCKIFIVGMSAYSKYKYSGNWYCTKETVWEIDKYYQQQCDKLDNFRYISLLPYRDMEYGNKYNEVDTNLRNSKVKEKELADHVHCGNTGYQQIADVYFRELIRQINLDS